MSKYTKVLFNVLDVFMIFMLTFGAPMSALADPSPTGATITTQLPDYPPGALVLMTGTGWAADESVNIVVNADDQSWTLNSYPADPIADSSGGFTYEFQLPDWYVPTYTVAATGFTSGTATVTFTDKPDANLDQCANLGTTCDTGTSSQWQNGNLGQSQATYFEGDSVPYRAVVSGLEAGKIYTLKIEYDTTQSGKHAIDYLTDFDRTETTADPCSGVAGVPSCASSTFPIPLDSNVSDGGVTQLGGQNFTIYNGTITGVSGYTLAGTYAGNSSTSIVVTFTATANGTAVLAWGGHIATRADWGLNNSAVAISGSPYHMRLTDFTCSNVSNCGVGNQDRSLSAGAVIFPASITIIKAATPEGSTSFPFSASPLPLADFALVDDGSSTDTQVFSGITNFTTYSVAENTPSGWSLTGVVCTVSGGISSTPPSTTTATVSINLQEGDNVICTYSNQQQAAQLTLVKIVTNDNGGTATEANFQAYINGSPVPWNSAQTLSPGSYTASEDVFSGYTASTWGGDCAADGSVALAAGESKTCTITNDDQQAYITVVKVVTNDNGGSANPDDFNLTLEGNAVSSGVTVAVNPGTYTAGETQLSGYTFEGFSGDCNATGDTTVALGETKTCTLTNNDQASFIIVNKVVINDNGGSAAPDDFDLTLEGSAVSSGVAVPVNPGTYTAGETLLSGYTFEGFSGDCDANGDVTVALGETKTCTLTNNDQQATITVIKVVTNDNGGSAVPDDFDLTLEGNAVSSGMAVPVNPGTYTAGETQLPGYTFEGFSGDCDETGSVTVALGETKTCTLTNNDQQAYVTVIKLVDNNNGGSADPNDFNLTLEGNPVSSGVAVPVDPGTYTAGETLLNGYTFTGFSGACDSNGDVTVALGESKTCYLSNNDQQAYVIVEKVVINDNGGSAAPDDFNLTLDGNATTSGALIPVNPGTYTADETLLDGYTFEGFSGDCDANGDVTVALGETKTCTFTNNDQQATITVIKVVTNDNGGSAAPNDFNLTLEGNAVSSGVAVAVNPGTYTAGETLLSGYTFEGFSGDCNATGSVTVALGETKTCTLTNNDQQAYITVVKVVTNNNGGSAAPDDFDLTLEGSAVSSGMAVPVNPGTYTAGETQLSGYTFEGFSGDCDVNGDTTVALGEHKTCTLTNNDQQAYITVVKIVTNNNGGIAAPNDFNLTLEGNVVSSGVAVPVNPGTYTADETLLSGYSFVGFSGECNSSGDVTVALGQSKTCTLTNNDIPPQLHLRKIVVNDNGGTALATAWTLNADGSGANDLSGSTPLDSDASLQADTFALSEGGGPAGYSASAWVCVGGTQNGSDITVGIGQSATCTITNNDIQPTLKLVKTVINDNGGTKTVADFPLFVNATSVTSGVANGFNAGSYTASESSQYGYTASAWSGDCAANGSVSLSVGQNKTCYITNDDQPGTIIIKKVVKPTTSQTSFSFDATGSGYVDFSLSDQQTNSQSLNAGSYSVMEMVPLGWVLTGIGGSADPLTPYNCTVTGSGGSTGVGDLNTQTATIDLKNGDTITCVFENTGQGATRTQGFWATHSQLAYIAWFGGSDFGHTFPGVAATAGISDRLICGRSIDDLGKLMGGFWSDISKKSGGAKRTALDQARMQLLQQLLAAELNASAFGSVPTGGIGMFAQWESALCGTNQNAITTAKQQAASFNTFGDSSTFTPGTSADSRHGRSIANIPFWDIIKP